MLAVVVESDVEIVGLRLLWFVYVQSTIPSGAMVMLAVAPLGVTLVPVPVAVHERLLSVHPLGGAVSVTLEEPTATPVYDLVPPLERLKVAGLRPPVVV